MIILIYGMKITNIFDVHLLSMSIQIRNYFFGSLSAGESDRFGWQSPNRLFERLFLSSWQSRGPVDGRSDGSDNQNICIDYTASYWLTTNFPIAARQKHPDLLPLPL
jgi:hypothetical protein